MASVDKVNGRWRARWRDPDGASRQRTFATKAEADSFAATRKVALDSGTYISPQNQKITVAEYAGTWLASKRRLANSTRDTYAGNLKHQVLPCVGHLPVSQVRRVHVEDMVGELTAQGLAPATVQKAFNVLQQMCHRAIAEGLLLKDPCFKVEVPKGNGQEMLYLTPAEVDRLCEAMLLGQLGTEVSRPQAALLTRFLAYTGLRWGEATALTVGDFDPLRSRVHVTKSVNKKREVGPTKNKKDRWVPVEPAVAELLAAHCKERMPSVLIFSTPSGRQLYASNFRRDHFTPGKRLANLDPGVRIHDLRHTCATWLLNEGVGVWEVAQWMGHTTTATTEKVYAHLIPKTLDSVAEKLSGVRGREGDGPATVAKVVGM